MPSHSQSEWIVYNFDALVERNVMMRSMRPEDLGPNKMDT